jgi:hypothetical protein
LRTAPIDLINKQEDIEKEQKQDHPAMGGAKDKDKYFRRKNENLEKVVREVLE